MKVLVTGGSGFVGRNLRILKPDWGYPTSKELNLLDLDCCVAYLNTEAPDAVIHLAGKVGGIKANADSPAEFFTSNVLMNTNLVHACYITGVKRLLASLSTCAFPDTVATYPFTEKDLLNGPPAVTNRSYGFAKRALYIQLQAYRKQYGLNYSSFCPSNLYGPEDCFNLDNCHFVAACVRRLHEAKEDSIVEFWGTGNPLRQQLYVGDLCSLLPTLLTSHETDLPLIVAPDENLSIRSMVDTCKAIIGKEVQVTFNGMLDGQNRKDGSNAALKKIVPAFTFTSFKAGIKQTYDWYKNENSINNWN